MLKLNWPWWMKITKLKISTNKTEVFVRFWLNVCKCQWDDNDLKSAIFQQDLAIEIVRSHHYQHSLPWRQSLLTSTRLGKVDNRNNDTSTSEVASSNQISRRLGPSQGWRSKRVRIAMALRQQGWTYQAISEHLFVSPKSIMRDIKCFVINPRNLPRPWLELYW